MITMSKLDFINNIIAQSDDEDYQESGDSDVDNLNYSWSGNREALFNLVLNNLDPDMPERKSNVEDYDYDHLQDVYRQIKQKYDLL